MKAVVDAFNQEKALVGAFSVIIQLRRLIVYSTTQARALAEHRRRLDTAARSRRMEQQIVRRIEARNPAIGQHLANNMKDYIVFRFKEVSIKQISSCLPRISIDRYFYGAIVCFYDVSVSCLSIFCRYFVYFILNFAVQVSI